MTVKLYIRNDGDKYVGIKPTGAAPEDTFLIRPGDARELIFDEVTNPDLDAGVLTDEEVKEINDLKYPSDEGSGAESAELIAVRIDSATEAQGTTTGHVFTADEVYTITDAPGTDPSLVGAEIQITSTAEDKVNFTPAGDWTANTVTNLVLQANVTSAPAPAPAPAAVTVPPWIIRDISQINPVVGIVDNAAGLHQGDRLVFTVVEGANPHLQDVINGADGQVQALTGRNIQIGYDGSLAGNFDGLVVSAVLKT